MIINLDAGRPGSCDVVSVVLQMDVDVVGSSGDAAVVPRLLSVARRAAGAEQTRQRLGERVSEVTVEIRVDSRVEHGVEVADPEEYADDDVGNRTHVAAAQCGDDVPGKEREPAEHEGSHDDA